MQNSYRTTRQSFSSAMARLGESSVTDNLQRSGSPDEAYRKAQAYKDNAMAMLSSFSSAQQQGVGDAMRFGLESRLNKDRMEQEVSAARRARRDQNTSNVFGTVAKVASTALPFLLACERRLKENITPISPDQAWRAVRNIPIYSFNYTSNPAVVYGPIADEVQSVEASLLRESLLGPDDDGPVRGFDVLRYQAMMAVALRHALGRIEALEAQLAAAANRRPWPENVAAGSYTSAPWPVEVADAR